LLQRAFLLSEDQHFYEHGGIDWSARAAAAWNGLRFRKMSRGASTISEQVVKMHHPRPRTAWAKWIETFEVMQLESQFNKGEIFEFYLNEVPYVSNRRGVVQGARHYFNRDLGTLSVKEILALVVLARAPSRYDLYKNPAGIDGAILRLAQRMREANMIDDAALTQVSNEKLELAKASDPVNAAHFVTYVRSHSDDNTNKIHTTLDANLQSRVQGLLDQRVKNLGTSNLHNGGALVMDHQTGEILAWVVAGANRDAKVLVVPGEQIDTVTTARQPGSSLKPFLYALALESGWNDNTIIDDSPLAQVIGEGFHEFANYSHKFYGNVTLRQALGNSLNIPALRTIHYTGVGPYLETLRALGFSSLKQSQEFYEEGLALGNGEVTLLELVQAYAALAQRGHFRTAHVVIGANSPEPARRVFSDETTSLISDILSDPKARQLEFGAYSVLNLPVQSAIKTGTSSDYHDAWAVGYNYRYVVGVWMGNLDRSPTDGVSGAGGPSLTLRSIFGELIRNEKTEPLYMSPKLAALKEVENKAVHPEPYQLVLPTPGLQIAIDPRVSSQSQILQMRLNSLRDGDKVEWHVNYALVATTTTKEIGWPLKVGSHKLSVVVKHANNTQTRLSDVSFLVK
jgi:penicillin-binding protein 1C